jgi:XTP/dITP diphosphohydrolase
MDLVLATRNAHKTREVQRILGPGFTVSDLASHPGIPEVVENGKSFQDNATLKAIAISKRLPGFVVADDSGLEVDALGGAPGIYSARYAGDGATDQANIEKLLVELRSRRCARHECSARFRCVLGLAREGELLTTFEGIVEGRIVDPPRGQGGFGYDPVFLPNGFTKTFGEFAAEEKDRVSHRARALAKLRTWLSS